MARPILSLALLVTAAAPVAAEDSLDLRLGLGSAPGIDRIRSDASGASNVDADGGGNIDLDLLYVHEPEHNVGFVVGGGIFGRTDHSDDAFGDHATVHAGGIQGEAALVFGLSRHWHLELPGMTLSIGNARVSHDGRSDSDTGGYGAVSVHGGIFYSFSFGLQLGLELGIESWEATVHDDSDNGGSSRFTYSGTGGYGSIFIGARF